MPLLITMAGVPGTPNNTPSCVMLRNVDLAGAGLISSPFIAVIKRFFAIGGTPDGLHIFLWLALMMPLHVETPDSAR